MFCQSMSSIDIVGTVNLLIPATRVDLAFQILRNPNSGTCRRSFVIIASRPRRFSGCPKKPFRCRTGSIGPNIACYFLLIVLYLVIVK